MVTQPSLGSGTGYAQGQNGCNGDATGGTGLGMNMVKEIVEANHGSIQVFPIKEADGRKAGTEFVLRFRILEGAEAYSE